MIRQLKNCLSVALLLMSAFQLNTAQAEQQTEAQLATDLNKKNHFAIRFAPSAIHLWPNEHNENNNMVGLEYNRWLAATFVNSFYDQTYVIAYHVYDREFPINDKWSWNARVPLGLMYGYDDDRVVTWNGFTPVFWGTLGLDYKLNQKWSVGANINAVITGIVIPEVQLKYSF